MDHTNQTTRNIPDDSEVDAQGPRWGTARFDDQSRLVLRFAKDNNVFAIDVHQLKTAIVGRSDQANTSPPTVDLAGLDGRKNGISRQHARIEIGTNILHIIDLASTNGTRLNGVPLIPYMPALLRDGDEVAFGELKCVVFFIAKSTD